MLFIAQWQAERLAGTLAPPPHADENAPAEPIDDHRDEVVPAGV